MRNYHPLLSLFLLWTLFLSAQPCSTVSPGTAATSSAACATKPVNLIASGTTTGSGITYQWRVSSSSTGPFSNASGGSGATSLSYTTGNLAANTNVWYILVTTCAFSSVTASTAPVNVSVAPLPTIAVSGGTLCHGNSFTLSPTGAASYSFSSGTAIVSPTNITSYTVTGFSAQGCVSFNNPVATLTVHGIPPVSITGPSTVCAGKTAVLTATGANTYTWGTSTGTSFSFSPLSDTTVFVLGRNTAGCTQTAALTVSLIPVPGLNLSGSSPACAGSTFSLQATGATSYTWSTGITGTTLAVTPSVTTSYTLTGAAAGCTASAVHTVTVFPRPQVTAVSSTYSLCSGDMVTFTENGADTYTWTGGAVAGTPFTPSLTSYTLSGTNANGCIGFTTLSLVLNPLPSLVLTSNNPVLCLGDTTTLIANSNGNVQWNTGQTTTKIRVSPQGNTDFSVTAISNAGCRSYAVLTQSVSDCTSLSESAGWQTISLFPNPASDQIRISAGSGISGITFELFGSNGVRIHYGEIQSESELIDVSGYPKGFYLVRLLRGSELVAAKRFLVH